MRPLFTVHAGEFLVGEHIERNFPSLNVWVPAKDTGVDLLVTDASARRTASLQVKLSRDYRPQEASDDFDRAMIAKGWLTLAHKKIETSRAEWWVIVLVSPERKEKPQFIVIPPSDLLSRLVQIHGRSEKYHFYPWVTRNDFCFDGRGMSKPERQLLTNSTTLNGPRNLSIFLNNWSCLQKLSNP